MLNWFCSWPYFTRNPEAYRRHLLNYHYLLIERYDKPFGYVHSHFVAEIPWPEYLKIDSEKRFLALTTASDFETRTGFSTRRCAKAMSLRDFLLFGTGRMRSFTLLVSWRTRFEP